MEIKTIDTKEVGKYLEGERVNIKQFIDESFYITDFCKVMSKESDCDHFYYFQICVIKKENGVETYHGYVTHTGARDVTAFLDKVAEGDEGYTIDDEVKLCQRGNKLYFDGYELNSKNLGNKLFKKIMEKKKAKILSTNES